MAKCVICEDPISEGELCPKCKELESFVQTQAGRKIIDAVIQRVDLPVMVPLFETQVAQIENYDVQLGHTPEGVMDMFSLSFTESEHDFTMSCLTQHELQVVRDLIDKGLGIYNERKAEYDASSDLPES